MPLDDSMISVLREIAKDVAELQKSLSGETPPEQTPNNEEENN